MDYVAGTPCVTTTPFATIWKTTTALTAGKKPRRTDADAFNHRAERAIPDPHNLTLRTFVNGELRHKAPPPI